MLLYIYIYIYIKKHDLFHTNNLNIYTIFYVYEILIHSPDLKVKRI